MLRSLNKCSLLNSLRSAPNRYSAWHEAVLSTSASPPPPLPALFARDDFVVLDCWVVVRAILNFYVFLLPSLAVVFSESTLNEKTFKGCGLFCVLASLAHRGVRGVMCDCFLFSVAARGDLTPVV